MNQLICGSGLGTIAEVIEEQFILDFHDIPGFPVSTGAIESFN